MDTTTTMLITDMVKEHLDQVIQIEEKLWTKIDEDFDIDSLHEKCYDKEQMDKLLLQPKVIGKVVLYNDSVVAFCIYEVRKDCFTILKIGSIQSYHPPIKDLLDALKFKIRHNKKRQRIEAEIEEELTPVHKMLSSEGFKATGVNKKDATYKFVYLNPKKENDDNDD